MILDRKQIFKQFPWIKEKNKKFIISADYNGVICASFLSHILNWELVGYYDLESLWVSNNKIDLIQAESINTLIKTENNIENSLSLSNLSGVLSKKIKNIEKKLINIITVLEHHLDFNDDEISKEEINTHVASIKKISNELSSIIKNSLLVGEKNTQTSLCLAGKPNVGKSSLTQS